MEMRDQRSTIRRPLFTGPADVRRVVKARSVYSHKGDFGYLLIVGGSDVYSGAPALAGMAALRTGVGLVVIAAPKVIAPTIRSYSPNVIVHSLGSDVVTSDDVPKVTQLIGRSDALVLGPGIGLDPETKRAIPLMVDRAVEMNKPILIDADAIKSLAGQVELLKGANTIITPHAGEFNAIAGIDAPPRWRERLPICTQFATKYSCVLLLKGHDTIVTDGQRVRLNRTGNPGMATGGMGDVLSGIIGTFLACGAEPFHAAAAGAYVHGLAGDLVRRAKGFHMVASDIIEALPSILKVYDRIRA